MSIRGSLVSAKYDNAGNGASSVHADGGDGRYITTAYTLTPEDDGMSFINPTASAVTITVPKGLGGIVCYFSCTSTGSFTFTPASGVTVNGNSACNNNVPSILVGHGSTGGTDYFTRVNGATVGAIPGTGSATAAASGYVGELIQTTVPVGSAVALTTSVAANMGSVSLTPGDWDVDVEFSYNLTGATVTAMVGSLSDTTALQGLQAGRGIVTAGGLVSSLGNFAAITGVHSQLVKRTRVAVTTTATVYAVATATFSAGTVSVFGTISARRVR